MSRNLVKITYFAYINVNIFDQFTHIIKKLCSIRYVSDIKTLPYEHKFKRSLA